VIWRLGAGLFLIVNVQISDDGAVRSIGASNQGAAGAIVHLSISAVIAQTAERRPRNAEAGSSPLPDSTMLAGAAVNTDGAARHGLRVLPPSASLESEPGGARRPSEAGRACKRCGSGPPLSSTKHGESTGQAHRHGFETRWHRKV
jgi:hypothetical protein